MPGLKRPWGHTSVSPGDECSSSDSDVSLVYQTNKKQRVSEAGDHDSDNEVTDDETLNIQATQYHQWQAEKPTQNNQPQENGIVETITCTNFMCHDYLQVDVGPLINFIIGHNGSGKSAILTALTVCLGGKASATNRAGSLKAFVKAGKESCTVAVKIKNQGETAYQQSLYGEAIIVERTFTISGSSGFKLKSSNGRIISTKKSDLDDITDFYALQLDNPLSVLTQDNARQFLNASTPADKYKFFMKGVQLEQLNQDYELLQDSIQQVENTFEDKQMHINNLEAKKAEADKNWIALVRTDNIRDEINTLRVKMAWAQVEDQENLLMAHDAELELFQVKLEDTQLEVQTITQTLDIKDQEQSQKHERVKDLENELAAKQEAKKDRKEEYDKVMEDMTESQREQRQIGTRIKLAKENVKKIEDDIRVESARLDEIHGGSHARLLAQLDQRRKDIEEARKRVGEHNAAYPKQEDMQTRAREAVDEKKSIRRAKEQDLKACERRMAELRQQGNRRSGFPPNTDALVKAIAQDTGFHEKPIGPFGSYIQLTEPIWGSILEKSLGGALNAYVVTNKTDQGRLNSIMRRVNCKCPVFIGNNNSFSTEGHEPDPCFMTVLKVLQISNDLITRQLIINQSIEQTILIEDQKEARKIMHGNRLRNVRQCFSINPNHEGCGIRFSYGQGLKSDPVDAYRGVPRIKTQIEDQISFEENQRSRLRNDLTSIEKEIQKLQAVQENCSRVIAQHNKLASNLQVELQRHEHEADNLQIAVDNETVEEGRLETLKKALISAEDEKNRLERMYEDAVMDRDRHDPKLAGIKRCLDDIDVEIKSIVDEHKRAQTALNKKVDERHQALVHKNQACEREASLKARQIQVQAVRNETSDTAADWKMKATTVGARVHIDPSETSSSIEQKLEKLASDILNVEARAGGNRRQLAELKRTASKNYEEALRQFNNEQKLADLLKQSLATRRERWGHFRKKIVARARCTFLHVLSERDYNGKLKVDHKARKLEIEIQPDDTQKNKQGRETTTLSGGEKSYSTICLLLSLWDAVGTPIRCLDEFDVFMDSINRDVSMKLIIKSARSSIGRQFILISPQAGIADRSRDIKIIRMRDPERNQTTLDVAAS